VIGLVEGDNGNIGRDDQLVRGDWADGLMDGVGGDWRGVLEKSESFSFLIVKGCLRSRWILFFDVSFFSFFFFLFSFFLYFYLLPVGYGMYVLPALYHYILSPQYSSWVTRAFLRRDSFLCFFFLLSYYNIETCAVGGELSSVHYYLYLIGAYYR